MIKKFESRSGETIAEVLVATLVVVLGVLLYSMMVTSSFRIINTSENKMREYYAAQSAVEQKTGGTDSKVVFSAQNDITVIGKENESTKIELFTTDEDIAAYRKKRND